VTFSDEELHGMIETLDMNTNGYIDYTEFLAASMDQTVFLKEENLRQAFKYFDRVIFVFKFLLGPKWDDYDSGAAKNPSGLGCDLRQRA